MAIEEPLKGGFGVAIDDPVWVENWGAGEEANSANDDTWLAGQRDALIAAVENCLWSSLPRLPSSTSGWPAAR